MWLKIVGGCLATAVAVTAVCLICMHKRSGQEAQQSALDPLKTILLVYTIASVAAVAFAAAQSWHVWEVLCVLVTFGTLLPLPRIVYHFRCGIRDVPEVTLPEGQDSQGLMGSFLFLWGLLDLIFDVGLCITLFHCGRWVLFSCCLTTLLVTAAITVTLGFGALRVVASSSADARQWLLEHGKLAGESNRCRHYDALMMSRARH
jgi:hypothetical protein